MSRETTAGTLRLIRALLDGKKLDRNSAAKIMGTQPEAAYRRLREVQKALGCVAESTENSTTVFRLNLLGATATTFEERIAAAFSGALGKIFPDPKLQAAFNAVRAKLSAGHDELEANMERKFFLAAQVGETALPESSSLLARLLRAVVEQRKVTIAYETFEGAQRNVEQLKPLSLFVHEHQLYLLADHPEKGFRNYRFARIERVDLSEDRFRYPASSRFDPNTVLRNSFGIFLQPDAPIEHVVIRLDKRWGPYAEQHRWHSSQVVALVDRHVEVRLDVRLCPELEQWILGFGEDAVVVRPPALRHKIAGRLGAATKHYAD